MVSIVKSIMERAYKYKMCIVFLCLFVFCFVLSFFSYQLSFLVLVSFYTVMSLFNGGFLYTDKLLCNFFVYIYYIGCIHR